jgi:cysteine-rich repeat protein
MNKRDVGAQALFLLTLGMALLLYGGPSHGATESYEPVADNWVNSCPGGWHQTNGTIDSGGLYARELRVRSWEDVPAPPGSGWIRVFRTLLKFDLSSLAGMTIDDATVGIYWWGGDWDPPSVQQVLDVHRMTRPWVEGASNWRYADEDAMDVWDSIDTWNATMPFLSGPGGGPGGGGDYDEGTVWSSYTMQWIAGPGETWDDFPGEWLEFDVTDLVQAWVDGEVNDGMLIKIREEPIAGYTTRYKMHSRECTECEGLKPYLEVTYHGCGDGTQDPGEGCDDGNLVDCDGCSSLCELETDGDDDDYYAECDDCDDTNDEVNPAHPEVPGNGLDDNCNGQIDEASCFIRSVLF